MIPQGIVGVYIPHIPVTRRVTISTLFPTPALLRNSPLLRSVIKFRRSLVAMLLISYSASKGESEILNVKGE